MAIATFPQFSRLPPELRDLIWTFAAVPEPGINFFNVHAWPNSHPGCNRLTSPPCLYLDLRRLRIEDDDDKVAEYDPSVWKQRYAVQQACHEARVVCARIIPKNEVLELKMVKPARGLFVRAADGQLERLNAETPEDAEVVETEARVCRTILVHKDDMVALSIENCSLNLPWQECPRLRSDDPSDDWDDEDVSDIHVTFSNEFYHPAQCLGIAPDKFCLNIARGDDSPAINWSLFRLWEWLHEEVTGHDNRDGLTPDDPGWLRTKHAWIMLDGETCDGSPWTTQDEEHSPHDPPRHRWPSEMIAARTARFLERIPGVLDDSNGDEDDSEDSAVDESPQSGGDGSVAEESVVAHSPAEESAAAEPGNGDSDEGNNIHSVLDFIYDKIPFPKEPYERDRRCDSDHVEYVWARRPGKVLYRDRFGDRYAKVACDSQSFGTANQLAKVRPESNDLRKRYVMSTIPPRRRSLRYVHNGSEG